MMSAIDELLRQNYFTASMMAAVPGTLAGGVVLTLVWRMLRTLRHRAARKYSRRAVQKRVRNHLRHIERLLLRDLHLEDSSGRHGPEPGLPASGVALLTHVRARRRWGGGRAAQRR